MSLTIGIFYHQGNHTLWDFFQPYIQRVIDSTSTPVDLYITYQKQDPVLDVIKGKYPNVILIESSLGCDCGGQLLMMHTAMKLGKQYDYVLKLHTKSKTDWRRDMMDPICGLPSDIQYVYDIFEKNPTIGMIGAQKWRLKMDDLNASLIDEICKRLDMKHDRSTQFFLGGTIFWMRWKTMVDIVTEKKIDLLYEYAMMEPGYLVNNRPTVTHSWERLFAVLVYNAGRVLHGVPNNSQERQQREKQIQAEKEKERLKREFELIEKNRLESINSYQLTFLEMEQKEMEQQECDQIKRHEEALKKIRQLSGDTKTLEKLHRLEIFHQQRLDELFRLKNVIRIFYESSL